MFCEVFALHFLALALVKLVPHVHIHSCRQCRIQNKATVYMAVMRYLVDLGFDTGGRVPAGRLPAGHVAQIRVGGNQALVQRRALDVAGSVHGLSGVGREKVDDRKEIVRREADNRSESSRDREIGRKSNDIRQTKMENGKLRLRFGSVESVSGWMHE
jgi:hypothetical protein